MIWNFLYICIYSYKCLSITLAVSHKFCCVVFIFIHFKLFSDFPIDLLTFCLTYWLFRVCCLISTYLWVSKFYFCCSILIPFSYGQKVFVWIISILLNLFVLWSSICCILETVPCSCGKNVYSAIVGWSVLYIDRDGV